MIGVHFTEGPLGRTEGTLDGLQWQPSDIAALMYEKGDRWHDMLVMQEGLQTVLAESQGYDRALNDNFSQVGTLKIGTHVIAGDGAHAVVTANTAAGVELTYRDDGSTQTVNPALEVIVSRDVGMCQINIPVDQVGTTFEEQLFDASYNVSRAYSLFTTPSNAGSYPGIRGWQPWVAWTSRICFRDTYVKRAARGIGNYLGNYGLLQHPDAAAAARYLTSPILDYTYRQGGIFHTIDESLTLLADLRTHLIADNQARVDVARNKLRSAKAWKQADHPWDWTPPAAKEHDE